MKKRARIFLTILLTIAFLASCENTTDMSLTGNKSVTTESANPSTTQLSKYGFGGDAEQKANDFLTSLKNKDTEGFISLINWIYSVEIKNENIQAYSFIQDIDIDSYKILKKETEKGLYGNFERFTVELYISKSATELFPVGTSRWILDIDAPTYTYNVRLFKNVDKEINIVTEKHQDNIVKFCCDFSFELNCYRTVTDFNTIVPVSNDDANEYFWQGLIRCLPVTLNEVGAVSREELEMVVKKVLGITSIDVTKDVNYDVSSDSVPLVFNTASWYTCSLASKEFDSKTKHHVIVIDYYSDTAYLLKAKTIKYDVRENNDKSYSLISTELLFDSGYEIASGLM